MQSIENAFLSYSLDERTRSFVKVQDGCDYNCSFCTIPMARGKSRSAKIEEIVSLIKNLKIKGFNEIVLSGINLGDFGAGTDESCYDLLNALENTKQKYGIACLCIGGGEASAMIVERINS